MIERKIQTNDSSNGTASELQKELIDKRNQLDLLKESIKRKNPLYYQNVLDQSHISLNEIYKKLLNDHQALLELLKEKTQSMPCSSPGSEFI